MQPSVGLDSVMAPNTTLTLRLCAVALLSNNVVRLHDSRFRHLLFIYAHLGTLERVDHFGHTRNCLQQTAQHAARYLRHPGPLWSCLIDDPKVLNHVKISRIARRRLRPGVICQQ